MRYKAQLLQSSAISVALIKYRITRWPHQVAGSSDGVELTPQAPCIPCCPNICPEDPTQPANGYSIVTAPPTLLPVHIFPLGHLAYTTKSSSCSSKNWHLLTETRVKAKTSSWWRSAHSAEDDFHIPCFQFMKRVWRRRGEGWERAWPQQPICSLAQGPRNHKQEVMTSLGHSSQLIQLPRVIYW